MGPGESMFVPYAPIRPVNRAPVSTPPQKGSVPATGESFASHLARSTEASTDVKLSEHAQRRLASRGLTFDAATRQSVSSAMDELRSKGAKDSLIICKGTCFLVNVPSRTVVTALDAQQSTQHVFTQIDSAIVL